MRFIWKILIINETKRALFVYPTIGPSCGRNFKYGYPYKVKVYSSISLICFLFFFCLSLACSKFFLCFRYAVDKSNEMLTGGRGRTKGRHLEIGTGWRPNCENQRVCRKSDKQSVEPPLLLLLLRLLVHMLHLQCLKPKTHISWQNAHKVCRKGRRNGIGI